MSLLFPMLAQIGWTFLLYLGPYVLRLAGINPLP